MSKKCKGNGKAKGWGCGTPLPFTLNNNIKTYKAKYGLGYDCGCFQKFLIGSEEGLKIIKKTSIKAKKKVKENNLKDFRRRKRESKQGNAMNLADMYFSRYIRLKNSKDVLASVSCQSKVTSP